MEINQIKKYIFKNVYSGVIKTFLTLLLSVIAIPLIIKNIGLEDYGLISIVLVFSNFTGLLDLGLSKAIISFQGEENNKEISAIYLINIILFSAVLLFSLIVFIFDINLLGKNVAIDRDHLRLMNFISLLLLALGIINNLLRASLEANFKLHLVNWGYLVQSAITNLGWLVLAYKKAEIIYFLIVPLFGMVITIVYHLLFLKTAFSRLTKPDRQSVKNVLRLTLQFFKLGVLNSIHLPLMQFAIILFLGDGRSIGIFELSTKLSIMTNNMLSYISNPFFSIISKHKDNNKDYLIRVIIKVTKILLLLCVLGYILFFLLNSLIINYFFKEYTAEIFHSLNLVLIGYLLVAASESIQKYYMGIGSINFVTKAKFYCILLNIIMLGGFYIADGLTLTNISFSFAASLVFSGCFWLFMSTRLKRGINHVS